MSTVSKRYHHFDAVAANGLPVSCPYCGGSFIAYAALPYELLSCLQCQRVLESLGIEPTDQRMVPIYGWPSQKKPSVGA
jgi:hypothetical protein